MHSVPQPSSVEVGAVPPAPPRSPDRHRLSHERDSITHKFSVAGHEGYIIVGLYPDGTPGELFLKVNKAGSTVAGLMNTIAIAVSTGLQHGVPLGFFVDKFSHARFEPSGWTGNHRIPYAKSLVDYIFQWLGQRFLNHPSTTEPEPHTVGRLTEPVSQPTWPIAVAADAPLCSDCGSLMTRNGSCFKCGNCGGTSGCS